LPDLVGNVPGRRSGCKSDMEYGQEVPVVRQDA
jgi:hypothetical protein